MSENGKIPVLITGASGFLGSHLARTLHQKGYRIHALVRKTSNLSRLKDIPVTLHFGNLWNAKVLEDAVRDKEYVFHCAGTILAKNREGYFRSNQEGTRNLVEVVLAKNTNLRKFVHISSQTAGNSSNGKTPVTESIEDKPSTYYGESKLAGEKEVLKLKGKIPVTIIRPPAIYGPSDRPTMNFFRFAKWGIIPLLGKEERFLSICHVYDVVQAIVLAAEKKEAKGNTYYVSDGEIYSWLELWKLLCKATGKRGRILRIPPKLFFFGANVSEFLGKLIGKPMMLNYHKATDLTKSWALDISKIKSELGFKPEYKFEDGAKKTFEWYKKAGWL